jgi:hypothetical protein
MNRNILILKTSVQLSGDELPSNGCSQHSPVEAEHLCHQFGEFLSTLRQIMREEISSYHTFILDEIEFRAEISPAGEFHLVGGGTHGGVRCVMRRRSLSKLRANSVVFDYGP